MSGGLLNAYFTSEGDYYGDVGGVC